MPYWAYWLDTNEAAALAGIGDAVLAGSGDAVPPCSGDAVPAGSGDAVLAGSGLDRSGPAAPRDLPVARRYGGPPPQEVRAATEQAEVVVGM